MGPAGAGECLIYLTAAACRQTTSASAYDTLKGLQRLHAAWAAVPRNHLAMAKCRSHLAMAKGLCHCRLGRVTGIQMVTGLCHCCLGWGRDSEGLVPGTVMTHCSSHPSWTLVEIACNTTHRRGSRQGQPFARSWCICAAAGPGEGLTDPDPGDGQMSLFQSARLAPCKFCLRRKKLVASLACAKRQKRGL